MKAERDNLPPALHAMDGFAGEWFVAGGWALDLFLGHVSRPHTDIEVALFRNDQRELRKHLAEWEVERVARGQRAPWAEGEWLAPPVHEVHVRRLVEPRWVFARRSQPDRLARAVAVCHPGHHWLDVLTSRKHK